MDRGEIRFNGGCVEGASGSEGRCWLCGDEWDEENCCQTTAYCSCMAVAQDWKDVSYKNVVLYLCHLAGLIPNKVYEHFWTKWYS